MMSLQKKPLNLKTVILLAGAIVIAVAILFPIYILLIGSLKTYDNVFDFKLLPTDIEYLTLQNYTEVLQDGIWLHLGNSLIIASAVTLIALFFHSMAGYALASFRFPLRNGIFSYILISMMIPFAVIIIPLFVIVRSIGLTNKLLGVIVPMIFNAYGIFLYRQFFLDFPNELREAARIDGLSEFAIFARLGLPLSKAITIALSVNFFIFNWNNYLWPLIIIQSRIKWPIQLYISNLQGDKQESWNLILSASCLAILPTLVLFILFQKHITENLKLSGIK